MYFEIKNIHKLKSVLATEFNPTIKLNLDIYDEQKNYELTQKINKYIGTCGCKTGSYFTMVSFLTVAGYIWFYESTVLWKLIYSVIFILLFSVLGKIIGLVVAKIRLNNTINLLKKDINYAERLTS